MMCESGNLADVRERLRAYARALDVEVGDHELDTILAGTSSLVDGLERLRKELAQGFRGDFLAFRLWQGLKASPADFRQPDMERRPFPSALLRHVASREAD